MGDQLYQKAVIIGQDLRTGVGISSVQTHTISGAGAVYTDFSGIRQEIIGRILGGDSGLNRISGHLNIILRLDIDLLGIQRIALCNQHLCLHNINTGNSFRYRMLHLNSGIHLNEIRMVVCVHQELQRSSTAVPNLL